MKAFLIHMVALLIGIGAACDAGVLPKALILGDSIYNEPSRSVAAELKGRVGVVWKHPGSSGEALSRIDELLGADKWEVIHFNFGLADLHYKDPRTNSIRAMSREAGGVRVTPPDQYEKNLQQLVERLKSTGAKLVWASTTPITVSDHLYDAGSEIEYNAIAARVMQRQGVSINDMHAFAKEIMLKDKAPSPLFSKKILLHPPIIESILKALELPAVPRGNG